MEDKAIAYQTQTQNVYGQKTHNYRRTMHTRYNHEAATLFKEKYKPADPFNGILICAEFLEVAELATVFRAALALEAEGNGEFIADLIKWRGEGETPFVRISIPWLNLLRQRKFQICKYLHNCCFGFDNLEEVLGHESEIVDINDPQLTEYLRQAQEALAVKVEAEVIQDAEN